MKKSQVNLRKLASLKGTYTNVDFKITLYICVRIKTIAWKFRTLNPKNIRVIYQWSL